MTSDLNRAKLELLPLFFQTINSATLVLQLNDCDPQLKSEARDVCLTALKTLNETTKDIRQNVYSQIEVAPAGLVIAR